MTVVVERSRSGMAAGGRRGVGEGTFRLGSARNPRGTKRCACSRGVTPAAGGETCCVAASAGSAEENQAIGDPRQGTVAVELRALVTSKVGRRVGLGLTLLVALATWANVSTLSRRASPTQAANAFTAINTSVALALLAGVMLSTRPRMDASLGAATTSRRRAMLGAQGRAAGIAGLAAALLFTGVASAIALPALHARGLHAPPSSTVLNYSEREAVAAIRLAIIAVAIGVVCAKLPRALLALATS